MVVVMVVMWSILTNTEDSPNPCHCCICMSCFVCSLHFIPFYPDIKYTSLSFTLHISFTPSFFLSISTVYLYTRTSFYFPTTMPALKHAHIRIRSRKHGCSMFVRRKKKLLWLWSCESVVNEWVCPKHPGSMVPFLTWSFIAELFWQSIQLTLNQQILKCD